MAYADSSLLLKLYLREPETPDALAAMGRASGPVFFTELHRLEIVNAVRRNLAAKRIRRSQALKALRTLRHDLRSGFYTLPPVDWPGVFRCAHRLSRRHAAKLAVRSLDLLHVALALEMSAGEFLSFDDRQGQTAKAEGLTVLP